MSPHNIISVDTFGTLGDRDASLAADAPASQLHRRLLSGRQRRQRYAARDALVVQLARRCERLLGSAGADSLDDGVEQPSLQHAHVLCGHGQVSVGDRSAEREFTLHVGQPRYSRDITQRFGDVVLGVLEPARTAFSIGAKIN